LYTELFYAVIPLNLNIHTPRQSLMHLSLW